MARREFKSCLNSPLNTRYKPAQADDSGGHPSTITTTPCVAKGEHELDAALGIIGTLHCLETGQPFSQSLRFTISSPLSLSLSLSLLFPFRLSHPQSQQYRPHHHHPSPLRSGSRDGHTHTHCKKPEADTVVNVKCNTIQTHRITLGSIRLARLGGRV